MSRMNCQPEPTIHVGGRPPSCRRRSRDALSTARGVRGTTLASPRSSLRRPMVRGSVPFRRGAR